MKTYLLLFFLICSFAIGFSQNQASDFTGNKGAQARNPRNDLMNFVPNEVLVKFKDAVPVAKGARLKAAGISAIDKVLAAHGITSLEKLFPEEHKPQRTRMMKSPQGKDMTIPALDKIFRVSIPEKASNANTPSNIFQLIEELKALPEVEYAEPNYIFSIGNFTAIEPEITSEELSKLSINKQLAPSTGGLVPNDPLFSQQWGIPATNIDKVWNTTTGDSTSIIAILDSGVDWLHPDLAVNIWENTLEIPNNDIDDDGNGLVDDIRGWDYINNDNNPTDDNSHGTHVAGIAAAVGNNGIGIAGVNWNAKIMPIKVFQSSGRGDAASIAKGINYAATKGATVINMSFGSYSESLTMKNALASAYATAVLVAAAGNDGIGIGPSCGNCRPLYPGAYSFVLGVEANENIKLAGFSNYDQDGPVFSEYGDLLNYELKAPGAGIISCVPGGNYRDYSGTSMAAPLVAGAVSLYRKSKPIDNQEIMWGNLINTSGLHFNIESAINVNPIPVLSIVKYQLADTLSDGDWDWKADAGETILLNVTVRNSWGTADSVYIGIEFQEFEDTTTASIEKSTALVGAIGPYASLSNWKNQLRIKIQPNVAHDRDIQFVLRTWKGYKKEYLAEEKITIRVEHGTELKGVLEDTLTLTRDKFWLVSNSFKIGPSGVLIIESGTSLKIEKQINCYGKITSNGTKQQPVYIIGPLGILGGMGTYNYTYFQEGIGYLNDPYFQNHQGEFNNCTFENLNGISLFVGSSVVFNNCVFREIITHEMFAHVGIDCSYSNFYNIKNTYGLWISGGKIENVNYSSYSGEIFNIGNGPNITANNFIGNDMIINANDGLSLNIANNYWGTIDSLIIEKKLNHFWDASSRALFKYEPKLNRPISKAHACVWKVLVNGKDAQDEFKTLDPLGVGTHKFEIYFNRPMNLQFRPTLTMGVREPYNQVFINENGTWSTDSLIYTVYKTIGLTTNNGLNRIKVVNGKDSDDFDLVPESERFNVNIQTTASASLDFMATPSLGKVKLEWNNNDLKDGLGYNMYRMEHINDSTLTSPVLINNTLIADTLYTDFAVTPNKKYYYYYKILRTNMAETDSSRVVSAIPFTASKGDANGDLSVNVLDITTIVAYLLNNNPQPFINEAADLNNDNNINVLDIVGVVNKILNMPQNAPGIAMTKQVELFMQNDTLFANSNVPVGGIQLDIKGISGMEDIQILKAIDGFESGYSLKSDSLRLIFYSMWGKNIPAGDRIPLLKLKTGSTIINAIFGETNGTSIKVNYILTRIGDIKNNMNQSIAELGQNFPNPVNGKTIIPIRIYEPVDEAILRVINMLGQEVEIIRLSNPYIGEHLLSWNSGINKGLFVYTLEIKNGNQKQICPNKKMIVQ